MILHTDDIPDATLDAAAALLATGERGAYYTECPGCLGRVHHSDVSAHPATCVPLRAMAQGVGA